MIASRKDLIKLLNINNNSLKQIEHRQTLSNRLQEIGFKLVKKFLKGNKSFYELEPLEGPKNNQIINKMYNIKKTDNFIDYFNIRTTEKPSSIEDIASKANINKNTVVKWDNTLENKRIISKDGYYYFRFYEGEIFQVTQEEYKSFWRNKAFLKAFKQLQNKYLKGEISLTELQLSSGEITLFAAAIQNKHYFKIKKYIVNKDNQLYIDTKKLIDNMRNSIK